MNTGNNSTSGSGPVLMVDVEGMASIGFEIIQNFSPWVYKKGDFKIVVSWEKDTIHFLNDKTEIPYVMGELKSSVLKYLRNKKLTTIIDKLDNIE
jgi:hypothetical protein